MNTDMAMSLINAALQAATLASKAITASRNGDEAAATAYLADARRHFDSARADWDAAPGPGPN